VVQCKVSRRETEGEEGRGCKEKGRCRSEEGRRRGGWFKGGRQRNKGEEAVSEEGP
jgi:hypothetical protein